MKIDVNNPLFWDSLYKENLDGWDLKSPTPVFTDLLNKGFFPDNSSILITGCGKGYDAIAAAEYRLNVTGIDFSLDAISIAEMNAATRNLKINFICEDIFSLPSKNNIRYDFIFDYVTYCAIDPDRREEYAEVMHSLLITGGRFLIILFPVEERVGGPPFAVNEKKTIDIFTKIFSLELSDKNINSIKPRKGREILHIYRKESA